MSDRGHYSDPAEAFLARTEPLLWEDHLIWTGAITEGYGRLMVDGELAYAHRYAWELEHGPIPDGLVIDHLCYVRCCVNVEHLRATSRTANNRNRSGANADNKSTGHLNVYPTPSGRYRVVIEVHGKQKSYGTFASTEEAVGRRDKVRQDLFGSHAGRTGG